MHVNLYADPSLLIGTVLLSIFRHIKPLGHIPDPLRAKDILTSPDSLAHVVQRISTCFPLNVSPPVPIQTRQSDDELVQLVLVPTACVLVSFAQGIRRHPLMYLECL